MKRMICIGLCGVALALSACDDETTAPGDDEGGGGNVGGMTAMGGGGGDGGTLPFALTSSAFMEGGIIPTTHECGAGVGQGPGDNLSPPLGWTAGPATTGSYAIVMRDIDAGGLVHWVVYDVPPTTLMLPMSVPSGYQPAMPAGAKQAEIQNSGYFGYFGPCSPSTVNTYQFTVHALPTPTLGGVSMQSTENEIAAAVEAASIASAALAGES